MARTDPLGGVAENEVVYIYCNHRMQAYATRQKRPFSTKYRAGGKDDGAGWSGDGR
jgi:hypothetical protein